MDFDHRIDWDNVKLFIVRLSPINNALYILQHFLLVPTSGSVM